MSAQPGMQEMIASAQTILGNLLRLLEFEDARIETATLPDRSASPHSSMSG